MPNDYISRDTLADEINHLHISLGGESIFTPAIKETILRTIDEQPTAPVEPVVHCGECKYYVDLDGGLCTHPKLQSDETPPTQKERSCSYGERKDGGENGQ
jgi:hypothetical protein